MDDSKRLHSPAAGLRRLECGVLALLQADPPPASLAELLARVAADDDSRASELPWYADATGGPVLPVAMPADGLATARGSAAAILGAAGVTAAEAAAAVVFEDRFNRTVVETGNKAACSWRFVAGHLAGLWQRHKNVFVALDRQGGRQFYAGPLERLFPGARCSVTAEGPEVSRYELRDGDRSLRLEVRARAEAAHLPVAYASMLAKYVRELLMLRFQRYWTEKAPEVRPTAGYYHDGQRFLREVAPRLRALWAPIDPSRGDRRSHRCRSIRDGQAVERTVH